MTLTASLNYSFSLRNSETSILVLRLFEGEQGSACHVMCQAQRTTQRVLPFLDGKHCPSYRLWVSVDIVASLGMLHPGSNTASTQNPAEMPGAGAALRQYGESPPIRWLVRNNTAQSSGALIQVHSSMDQRSHRKPYLNPT